MLDYARDAPRFVRFVNMLINDSIYAMDEALSKLKDIRDTQNAMADEAAWARLPGRQRQQQQQQLSQNENTARYFMQFTNEVLHMLSYLSAEKDVAVVFMLPELAGRVASMLNYFLSQLVGPKSTGLKVKDPDKFFFHPKRLLCEIATTNPNPNPNPNPDPDPDPNPNPNPNPHQVRDRHHVHALRALRGVRARGGARRALVPSGQHAQGDSPEP